MVRGAEDRTTLGVTPEGQQQLEELLETGWFDRELDAFKLAIAVALDKDLIDDEADMKGVQTKFNVGTLDRDGAVRSLLRGIAGLSEDRPYAQAERRAAAGLRFMHEQLVDAHRSISDVLGEVSGADEV